MNIPDLVNAWSEKIANETPFVKSKFGQMFLSIVLLGPLTFIPTIYAVWTEQNIDAFRTSTWPLLLLINLSAWIGLTHEGDWRMRLVGAVWVIAVASIFLATLVR